MRRGIVLTVLSLLLAVGMLAPAASAAPPTGTVRVLLTFEDGRSPGPMAHGLARAHGGEVAYVYAHAINGAAIDVPRAALRGLERAVGVVRFELDAPVTTSDVQADPTWGLDRIDQRALPLDSSYRYDADGTGVRAYIVDTGILASHVEFSGRVAPGATVFDDGWGSSDCNGHGTHVAGTVGGSVYGVAKQATLIPVRVLDCNGSGTWSGVIAGLDWVAAQEAGQSDGRAVANMSLGGGASDTVDDAVRRVIDAGVPVVVAAGNDDGDACGYSPARVAEAITVGSTDASDARSYFSNHGACVDIFAPGSSIQAAYAGSDTQIATLSGTSMAAPHVAGIVALASPATDVVALVIGEATAGALSDVQAGSPNLLAYSLVTAGDVEPPVEDDTSSPDEGDTEAPDAATLSASVSKVRGRMVTSLTWSGLTEPATVYRDDASIASGVSGSSHVDETGLNGTQTFDYQVCAGDVCTNVLRVSDDGTVTDPGDEPTDPIDEPTDPIDEPIDEPIDDPVDEPIDEPINDPDHTLDLDGRFTGNRIWWSAEVTATLTGTDVEGVLVEGTWAGTLNGSGSCVTDTTGSCTIDLGRTRTPQGDGVTFTATSHTAEPVTIPR